MLKMVKHERVPFIIRNNGNIHFGGYYTLGINEPGIDGFQSPMPDLHLQRLPANILAIRLRRCSALNRILQIRGRDIESLDFGTVEVRNFALVWINGLIGSGWIVIGVQGRRYGLC